MKKYFVGFSALLLALTVTLGLMAKQEPKPALSAVWFDFTGALGEESQANKYQLDGDNSPECAPAIQTYRCEILAVPQTGNPNLPDLSNIQDTRYKSTP